MTRAAAALLLAACWRGEPPLAAPAPAPRTPPPPDYAALFVEGATWELPCWRGGAHSPFIETDPLTCRARDVHRVGRAKLVNLVCEGRESRVPGGWFAMLPDGLYYLKHLEQDDRPPWPSSGTFGPGDDELLARDGVWLMGPRRQRVSRSRTSDLNSASIDFLSDGDAERWCAEEIFSNGGGPSMWVMCVGRAGLVGSYSGHSNGAIYGTKCGETKTSFKLRPDS